MRGCKKVRCALIRVQPRKFISDPATKCYLPRQARAAPEGSVVRAATNELCDELGTNPLPYPAGCHFVAGRTGRSPAGGGTGPAYFRHRHKRFSARRPDDSKSVAAKSTPRACRREYWRHRLQMARAMGLNTVCAYLFWNLNEPRPGNSTGPARPTPRNFAASRRRKACG